MKVQLVIIVVEKRGDEAAGTGPYGLQLVLYLNFDSAQGGFNADAAAAQASRSLNYMGPFQGFDADF